MNIKRLITAKSSLIMGLLVLLPVAMFGNRYHDLKFTVDPDSVAIEYPEGVSQDERIYVGTLVSS